LFNRCSDCKRWIIKGRTDKNILNKFPIRQIQLAERRTFFSLLWLVYIWLWLSVLAAAKKKFQAINKIKSPLSLAQRELSSLLYHNQGT